MEIIEDFRQIDYFQACEMIGKAWHFTATCTLFPQFDVKARVVGVKAHHTGEMLIDTVRASGKHLTIGSRMTGLRAVRIQSS